MNGEQEAPQQLVNPDQGTKTPFYKNNYGLVLILFVLTLAMIIYIVFVPSARKLSSQTFLALTQNNRPSSTPSIPIPTVTPEDTSIPDTPTPTLVPGISWVTYTNAKYGYSIKYSPDWVVQDQGALEPLVPSFVVFNTNIASTSSRFISVSVSTRSYSDQLAIGGAGTPITVAAIKGTKEYFQDSSGEQSEDVVLPRTNDLLIIRAKSAYETIFNYMLSTLKSD